MNPFLTWLWWIFFGVGVLFALAAAVVFAAKADADNCAERMRTEREAEDAATKAEADRWREP